MHDRFQAVVPCPWAAQSTGSPLQADSFFFFCLRQKYLESLAAGELPICRLSSTSRPLEGAGSPVTGTGLWWPASYLAQYRPSTASTEKPLEYSFKGNPV